MLVSRDASGSGTPDCKQAFLSTTPRAQEEFKEEITRAWEGLYKPVTVPAAFEVKFSISSDMTPGEMQKAAQTAVNQSLAAALEKEEKKLAELDKRRSFSDGDYASLVYRALCALAGEQNKVDAFVYFPPDSFLNLNETKGHVIELAKALKIPAGTDFNARPLIAFSDDDSKALDERFAKAKMVLRP